MALTVETITGTTHTITDADDGKLLLFTSDTPVTITCPDTMTAGSELVCVQAGDGQITFSAGGSSTFLNAATPQSRNRRAYIAVTLESNATYAFNGRMGADKVLVNSNFAGSASPLVTNDDSEGYAAGSLWIFGNDAWICTDATTGAAVWYGIGDMFSEGATMSGVLDMGSNTIDNVTDPTTAQQAATKAYVDANTGVGNGDIKSDGTVPFAADQSMGGFKVTNLATPTVDTDASTKKYVDDQITGGTGGFILADGSNDFTGEQSMGSNKLTNVTDPTLAQDAATKAYVDSNPTSALLADGSVTATGDLVMGSNKITGLANPTNGDGAANKTYVDNAINNSAHIKRDGSLAFTGNQSMGSNKLTNVGTPTSGLDATNKTYVDSAVASGGNIKADGSVAFYGTQSMGNNKITNVTDPTSAQDAATKAYVDSQAGGGANRKPATFILKFQAEEAFGFEAYGSPTTVVPNQWYGFQDTEDGTTEYLRSSSTNLNTAVAKVIQRINNQGQSRTKLEIEAYALNTSDGATTMHGKSEHMFDWENGSVMGDVTYKHTGRKNNEISNGFSLASWTPSQTTYTGVTLWDFSNASALSRIGTSSLGLYSTAMYIKPSTRSFTDGSGNSNDVLFPNFTEWNGSSVTTREMSYTYKFTNYFD